MKQTVKQAISFLFKLDENDTIITSWITKDDMLSINSTLSDKEIEKLFEIFSLESFAFERTRLATTISEFIDENRNLNLYRYTCSTEVIWTDFDSGTVKAKNYDDAYNLARIELSKNLRRANRLLDGGFNIDMDMSQLKVELVVA